MPSKIFAQTLAALVIGFCATIAIPTDAGAQTGGWQQDIEPYVKPVSRPLDIYTWEHRRSYAPQGILEPRDPRAFGFLSREADKFWDVNRARVYQGPNGPYFASDPFSSREYGNGQVPPDVAARDPNWSLIRVTLAPGTRLIDARIRTELPASVRNYIRQFGCGESNLYNLFKSKSNECHRAFTSMARETRAAGIQLFFPAFGPAICGTHTTIPTDYVIFDGPSMQDFASFTSSVPAQDPLAWERSFINTYYVQTRAHIERTICAGGPAPVAWENRFNSNGRCGYYWTSPARFPSPYPNAPLLPQSDFESRVATRIMGCSNPLYSEDSPQPRRIR